MDFGRISRRHLLQGSAALTLGSALGVGSAAAADTTIGFIYVGSRDDYGYNQAHAQGAAALKKMADDLGQANADARGGGPGLVADRDAKRQDIELQILANHGELGHLGADALDLRRIKAPENLGGGVRAEDDQQAGRHEGFRAVGSRDQAK